MVLIKMGLVIFLVLGQYGLAYKYGIIFQISIYNWRLNCIFWYLDVFSKLVFSVDFVLKIKYNLCLFSPFWLQINHKTRHCKGENSSIRIHKMYKEKFLKKKILNFQIRKNELVGWKVVKHLFNVSNF